MGEQDREKKEQVVGYIRETLFKELEALRSKYPRVSRSDLIEAGLTFYMEHAKNGIDANLQPIETGPVKKRGRVLGKAG